MRTILIVICSCLPVFGQNVLVRFAKDCPPCPESTNGCPALTVIGFNYTASGTFTAPWSTNWTVARFNQHQSTNEPLYDAWYAGVQSNRLFQINQTLTTLNNLYQTNINFMGLVATNRPAITVTVLSNQTVTVTRILNQLAPLLKDLYAPRVASETP
jgi:hypothetical protein